MHAELEGGKNREGRREGQREGGERDGEGGIKGERASKAYICGLYRSNGTDVTCVVLGQELNFDPWGVRRVGELQVLWGYAWLM